MQNTDSEYAQLPDELLGSIIEGVSSTVTSAHDMVDVSKEEIMSCRAILTQYGMLAELDDGTAVDDSIVAVDGGFAVERLPEFDVTLAQAVGVEGLANSPSKTWKGEGHQYLTWQAAVPHDTATPMIIQGIMTLMEMLIIARSSQRIRILDGSHIGLMINMNKFFSSLQNEATTLSARVSLDEFCDKQGITIRDIPGVVRTVLNDDRVIASTKYNSSKDITQGILRDKELRIDDKALFSKILEPGEYLVPQPIGLSAETDSVLRKTHIDYMPRKEMTREDFNWLINEAIGPVKTNDIHGNNQTSNIFYTYFKPTAGSPVYRIEVKHSVAEDKGRLDGVLASLWQQVVYPEIIEPYPQYLADRIAKSAAKGMKAIRESVILSTDTKDVNQAISLLQNYRSQ